MCGIVGCVLDKKAAPIIIDSIKKLEYRGYDSVGIATVTDSINVKKGSGKIKEVDDEIKLKLGHQPEHITYISVVHTRKCLIQGNDTWMICMGGFLILRIDCRK